MRALARAALVGLGEAFLAAEHEDDIAAITAAVEVATELRDGEYKRLADLIGHGTRKVLGG